MKHQSQAAEECCEGGLVPGGMRHNPAGKGGNGKCYPQIYDLASWPVTSKGIDSARTNWTDAVAGRKVQIFKASPSL